MFNISLSQQLTHDRPYMSTIEALICRREMSLIRSTSFGFAQNTIHDFSKYRIELIVALSYDKCHENECQV